MQTGDAVAVTATVRNEATVSEAFVAVLTVGGSQVTAREYAVPARGTQRARFVYRPDQAGEFPVSVSGERAGLLTVGSGDGGGLIPWGLLRTLFLYVVVPVGLVYGALKGVAIYLGY